MSDDKNDTTWEWLERGFVHIKCVCFVVIDVDAVGGQRNIVGCEDFLYLVFDS